MYDKNFVMKNKPKNFEKMTEAMLTPDGFQTDPVKKLDPIGLVFIRDRSGTGPKQIQKWTCCFADPVLEPIRTVSITVPCKHLDRF